MLKKGDTLIEVTLAVGIFSLVAIAVVAVVKLELKLHLKLRSHVMK